MQNILITGASRGLGFEFAKKLGNLGYGVYAGARNLENALALKELSKQYSNVLPVSLDVTSDASVDTLMEQFKKDGISIDILINNAGYGIYGPTEAAELDEARAQFEVNVFGVIRLCHAVIPQMRARKKGRIINVSSIVGLIPSRRSGLYAATKHALEALSASYAFELKKWGIEIANLHPGPTATQFAHSATVGTRFSRDENPYDVETEISQFRANIQNGQDPKEVADVLLKIVESDRVNFWNPSSPAVHQMMKKYYKDTSGNSLIDG